jgi:FKBP-type peptidyl-prolyl cis-trans isomerase (trigger factor)
MKAEIAEREGSKVRVDVEATEGEYMDALSRGLPSFLASMGVQVTPDADLDQALRAAAEGSTEDEIRFVKLDCAASYLMPRAVEQAGLFPACTPAIVGTQQEADGSLTFGVEVYPKPHVDLSSYEPVRIAERAPMPVTEEEIDQRLAAMAMRSAVTQPDIVTGKPKKVPALIDDGWVSKNVDGCSTVDELREKLRETGERYKRDEFEHRKQNDAIAELARRMEGDIPDDLVNAVAEGMMAELASQLSAQGMTIEQFAAQRNATDEQIRDDARRQARENLIQGAVLDSYFAHECKELKEGDIESALSVIAPGMEEEALRAFMANGFMFTVTETAQRLRATCAIMETAVVDVVG